MMRGLGLGIACLFLVPSLAGAYALRPSDPDRDALLCVAEGFLRLSPDVTRGTPSQAFGAGSGMALVLESVGIGSVERLPSRIHGVPIPFGVQPLAASRRPGAQWLVVSLPSSEVRKAFLETVRSRPEILFAEPDQRAHPRGVPNDPGFKLQWSMHNGGQASGKVDADIDATNAWDMVGASAPIWVAVIDVVPDPIFQGVSGTNPDLAGRVTAPAVDEGPGSNHPTAIAGIIGARGNDGVGIAGLNWSTLIRSFPSDASVTNIGNMIAAATTDGITLHNDSWGFNIPHISLQGTMNNAYRYDVLSCVAMPTTAGPDYDYPSLYKHGILSVAALTNTDQPPTYAVAKSYVDVAAPGGSALPGQAARDIYSTLPGSNWGYMAGTSIATAHVTGLAGLLKRYASDSLGVTLYNDDISNIIRYSADDVWDPGYDTFTGYGRINARKALAWLRTPGALLQQDAFGGTVVSISGVYQKTFVNHPCGSIADGNYAVKRHEVRRTVTFSPGHSVPPYAWGRGVTTVGMPDDNPEVGQMWCEVVPGSVTTTGCELRTYVYQLFNALGAFIGWCPGTASGTRFSYTVMKNPGFVATSPSPTLSYYVPQTGSVASPTEGTGAIAFFRACPNNDAASVPNNARVKVVLKDSSGVPIVGVAPEEIFVLFNGGTPTQGFTGIGADSVIANSQFNLAPPCPDVRYLHADAPTDATGVTYITFKGSTPGSPGVATRDPQRKWGHYDSKLPVFVSGVELQGRLTSASDNGSYVLQIKNLDLEGGLGTGLNQGEIVSSTDVNSVAIHAGEADSLNAKNWWRDFNSDGAVSTSDFNLISLHVEHDCDSPNNP